jgi:hypothetical protein
VNEIDIEEVLAELDPLGRALFDTALGRVRLRKAMDRIRELETQREDAGGSDS